MSFCPNCGTKCEALSRFCPNCGTPVAEDNSVNATTVLGDRQVNYTDPSAASPVSSMPNRDNDIGGTTVLDGSADYRGDFQSTMPPVPPQSTMPPVPPQSTMPPVPPQSTMPPVPPQSTMPPVPPQSTMPPVPTAQVPYQFSPNNGVPQKKSGLSGWMIVLIIVGVLVVIGIILAIVIPSSSHDDGEDTAAWQEAQTTTTVAEETQTTTAEYTEDTGDYTYTKGVLQNGCWVNNWANMKFDLAGKWQDVTANFEGANDTDEMEFGLAISSPTSNEVLAVAFSTEPLASESEMAAFTDEDIEELLDTMLESGMDGAVTNIGGSTVSDAQKGTVYIAGAKYQTLAQTAKDTSGHVYQLKFYLRIYEQRAILIELLAEQGAFDESVINQIEAAHLIKTDSVF